jgi:hypothetical protein
MLSLFFVQKLLYFESKLSFLRKSSPGLAKVSSKATQQRDTELEPAGDAVHVREAVQDAADERRLDHEVVLGSILRNRFGRNLRIKL